MSRSTDLAKRHDHRQSLWIMAGGRLLWCYRCGAIRAEHEKRWNKPTGPNGANPAIGRF